MALDDGGTRESDRCLSEMAMAGIDRLSNEILREILDRLEIHSLGNVAVDRRNHLSVESFRPPSPLPPSQLQTIANVRLTCRRFSELGASYQFSRVSLRFSISGFRRLERISEVNRLAKHVKKFTYLVPPFYAPSKSSCFRLP